MRPRLNSWSQPSVCEALHACVHTDKAHTFVFAHTPAYPAEQILVKLSVIFSFVHKELSALQVLFSMISEIKIKPFKFFSVSILNLIFTRKDHSKLESTLHSLNHITRHVHFTSWASNCINSHVESIGAFIKAYTLKDS